MTVFQPIPRDVMNECYRLVRMHYGNRGPVDFMAMAAAWARGMEYAREQDKQDREAYEAERAEWEAERAEWEANPIAIDVDVRLSDQAVEDLRARLAASMKTGEIKVLGDPPEYTPIRKIRQEAAQKERDEIAAHINDQLNKTLPSYDDVIAAFESIIDWLDKRNEDANRERGTQDNDTVREPE